MICMLKKLILDKKYTLLLILLIVLYSPGFYTWAENLSTKDKIIGWTTSLCLGISLFTLSCFFSGKKEKIYLAVLFALSILPNSIVWTYLYLSDIYMCKDMYWVIFNSNIQESAEYFSSFIGWTPILAGIGYTICGIALLLPRPSKLSLSFRKYKGVFSLSLVALIAIISFQYLVKAVPLFDFYKSGICYVNEINEMQKEIEIRKTLSIQVERDPSLTPGGRVFVVIIGESLSSEHMGLYGYGRNTTPKLSSHKDELDIYTDVVTCDTHTIGVLKKVLTFADHKHPDWYIKKPSIVELFNCAGFETYWISNQELVSKWGGNYGIIAQESHHTYDLSVRKKGDEIILPQLQEILNDSITKDKLIFIHMMGSHHQYNCRYPENFNRFNHHTDPLPPKEFADERMLTILDEYDNSVLYTDSIVNTVIDYVEQKNNSSFVLFFSDHGEEVYDYRAANGHFMTNAYPSQCRIPFILWRSNAYRAESDSLVFDYTRPYSNEHLIYAISDLCGLRYNDFNPTLSLFSKAYVIPDKRLVGNEDFEKDILPKIK